MKRLLFPLIFFTLVTVLTVGTTAQTEKGSIIGTVVDANGGAVANASVAVTTERSVAAGGGPASDGRVAQAGKGNSATSGTGMSGWLMNIVPGLAISERFC